MNRNVALFVCACFITNSVWARGPGENETGDASFSIVDHYGRTVVFDAPVQSMVSLAPGITETVFALGYGDRLAGRSAFCDYPPEAAAVPEAGNLLYPDAEAIVALQPDAVIASTHFPQDALMRLESLGLTVAVMMGGSSFEGTYDGVIRPLARMFGDVEAGETVVRQMQRTVQEAMDRVTEFTRSPTVYYAVGFGEGGDWTAGGDTFIGEMIRMAGGINIAADVKGWAFSLEALLAADPGIIIVPEWAVDQFPAAAHYRDLTAVINNRVFPVNEDIFSREGPRLAEAFTALVNIIAAVQ